ncbi:glycosyltransferase family 2 protein [Henriciella mobilis]|uniref:Glycosyltransferase family 2 protein n=1 Tax=Henriciella mobilis TaxID=2305467 RepID=A0A399RKT5_9PROT|nr:glycosyltransferase family 2 protein [Henriciella mobilis]RIJ32320.1 glycosyltransferase family 2 protein [Henriciella mobilis]
MDYESELKKRGWEVPAFNTEVLAQKRSRYVVVIPVINEGERIRRQLSDMAQKGINDIADVVVLDGGSTDGSLDLDFLRSCGVRALITKTGPGKLSAQLRCGYAWALIEGYDGIVTIDGNGKDGVEAIPLFISHLEDGYDYLQASRFIKGGYSEHTPLSRLVAIKLIHAPLQSLAARHWFTDTTQGFRGYSARYLLDERVKPFRSVFSGYELLAYLTARASQIGYKVKELPTSRIYPANEPTPTKIKGFSSQWKLIEILFAVLRGAYNPR